MAFSEVMKNQEKQEKQQQQTDAELHAEVMGRCIPVAKKILKIIVDRDLTLGDSIVTRDPQGRVLPMKQGERPEDYKEAALEIMQVMLDADIRWGERSLVFALVKQPMDMLSNIVTMDTDKTYQDAMCRMHGISIPMELSMQMVDAFCKQHQAKA